MAKLGFDGRVAVVTGAGAGLGRAYALLLASRGAKVVVNDLGGGRHGDGKSSSAADKVVKEIVDNGGVAVADYNSVVEGDKIIQTAMEKFGRVDILINNAGILRDKSFARISNEDWDLIHAVHLKGSFKTTQAAWPIFKKQNYGRIIMTASNSGVYGNFGQANYSAAKLGLVGLANTLSIEGRKNNIKCNVIVPTAASRLTEDILPPDLYNELRPELIAPVVVYMCHDSCEDSGAVIDSGVGWASKIHMVRGSGAFLRKSLDDEVTVESVRDNWERVIDMSRAERLNSIEDATGSIMANLQELKDSAGLKNSNVCKFTFNSHDFILYALGIGATITTPSDFKYLYENDMNFGPIPTFFIAQSVKQSIESMLLTDAMPPGKEANITNILHGEQYLEIVGDLPPPNSVFNSVLTVSDVLDKGSGLVVLLEHKLVDANGNVVVRNQSSIFVVGMGGFGGPRTSENVIPCVSAPKRKPDSVIEQKTTLDQAALYRLSGDINPLHIDPEMATLSGYKKPILHGLCSLGFSARHVLMQYGNNDAKQMKCLKARFAKPVTPGETLRTSMWKENNRIHFETSVKETGNIVISGAYIDLKQVSKMPVTLNLVSAVELKSDGVFARIIDGVKEQPDKAKSVNGVFVYNITSGGKQAKQWTLDCKSPAVYEGAPKGVKADTTITISDEDMVDLATGKLNPQVAFMKGKLKITGNIMLTQKLAPLLKAESKL